MLKKMKRSIAFLSAAVMVLACLQMIPMDYTGSWVYDIPVSAVDSASSTGDTCSHSAYTYISNQDGTHWKRCDSCKTAISDPEPCSFNSQGICPNCDYVCPHTSYSGGICTVCGVQKVNEVTTLAEATTAFRTELLERSATIQLVLSGEALNGITTDNCSAKSSELFKEAVQHIDLGEAGWDSRLGDYIAKSVGGYEVKISGYTSAGKFVELTYSYAMDYYTDLAQENEVAASLQDIYSSLNLTGLSDQEKVFRIYSWITNHVSYDYDNLENTDNKTKYTAYGALHDNKAVCQGFAALFYRMCMENGINCRIVTGTAGNPAGSHAWNIVQVEDSYYYTDITWDCFVIEDAANSRQEKPGTLFFFLRNTLSDHTESEDAKVTDGYAMATDSLSGLKAVAGTDGSVAVVHLDGTSLTSQEKLWYRITVSGKGCSQSVTVTPAAVGLTDQVLLSETIPVHSFDTDGFCTKCDSGYQPAELRDGVYEISNAGQLYWFAQQVNQGALSDADAGLTADIQDNAVSVQYDEENGVVITDDADNPVDESTLREWTPIGSDTEYSGTFDGNQFTISGLYVKQTSAGYAGLFARNSGTIQNVGIIHSCFSDTDYVGGVCAYNTASGKIINCFENGILIQQGSAPRAIGGVCGYNGGTIEACYHSGRLVSSGTAVGGVCGTNDGTIFDCYYHSGDYSGNPIGTGSGTAEHAAGKTSVQFSGGEVAYLLQQAQTAGRDGTIPQVWGQDFTIDSYPVLGGKPVYASTGCVTYSNTEQGEKPHTDADGNGICDDCGNLLTIRVELNAVTNDGKAFSGAQLDGSGTISAGSSTIIAAGSVSGYTFLGWFDGETLVSSRLSFTCTPEADISLTAKYQLNSKRSVTIDGGTAYTVSINGGDASACSGQQKTAYAIGTRLTVSAEGENFAYWVNEAGSILSRSAEYSFTVVHSCTVTAAFHSGNRDKVTVVFLSGYDQVLSNNQYAYGESIFVPSIPTKTGCVFTGWSINGDAPLQELTAKAVQTAVSAALATGTISDDLITVQAVYAPVEKTVTVTVINGMGGGVYPVNDIVTVMADVPEEGRKFSHWTDGTEILSYNPCTSFYAAGNITLTAVYVDESVEVEAKGITEVIDIVKDETNKKISVVTMSTVSDGCTILNAGIIATSDESVANGTFDDTTAEYVRGTGSTAQAFRYTWSKNANTEEQTWYVRAYLVYEDADGNIHTIYGQVISISGF